MLRPVSTRIPPVRKDSMWHTKWGKNLLSLRKSWSIYFSEMKSKHQVRGRFLTVHKLDHKIKHEPNDKLRVPMLFSDIRLFEYVIRLSTWFCQGPYWPEKMNLFILAISMSFPARKDGKIGRVMTASLRSGGPLKRQVGSFVGTRMWSICYPSGSRCRKSFWRPQKGRGQVTKPWSVWHRN